MSTKTTVTASRIRCKVEDGFWWAVGATVGFCVTYVVVQAVIQPVITLIKILSVLASG